MKPELFKLNWTTKSGRRKHCLITGLGNTLKKFTKRKRCGNRRVTWEVMPS